jgi:hypothetical protein
MVDEDITKDNDAEDERLKTISNYKCFRISSILNFSATLEFL